MSHDGGSTGILLILAIAGLVCDRRYLKAGGKPPSDTHYRLMFITMIVFAAFVAVLSLMSNDPGTVLIQIGFRIGILLFALWQLGRFRMRRKYPLYNASKSPHASPPPTGALQPKYCVSCGAQLSVSENFCHNCGAATLRIGEIETPTRQ